MGDWKRPLSADEAAVVAAARQTCFLLYEGRVTPHRSCGIALAETFGLATPPYQALRRGGITGAGECGTVVAGRLILGQLLGDADPTGSVTPALLDAAVEYDARWPDRLDRRAVTDSIICNDLTGQFDDFKGPARASFCTSLAAEVAALVAEVLVRNGLRPTVSDPPG